MSFINQEGFFHGTIVDAGLSQSSGGFPQEVLALQAAEVYDPDSESYLPADPTNNEITCYLVLIDGKDRETLNAKQLKKVTGWDGASFVGLSEMDLVGMPIAFRVEEREWNDNVSLQVTWIDTIDASPFRTVQKLDKDGIIALQQRYATVLASSKAAVKPTSAPAKAKTAAKAKTKAPAPVSTKAAPQAPAKPAAAPKAPPAKPKPVAPKRAVVGKCTADDAYNACYTLKRDDVTDEALNEVWLKAVAATGKDESEITDEEWFQIKESILKEVSKV